jgi:hypothetical protein
MKGPSTEGKAGVASVWDVKATGDRPKALAVQAEHIPAELRARARWVVWGYVPEKDPDTGEVDWDKPPVNARTRRLASSTNPETWSTHDKALAAYRRGGLDGVGFVLDGSDDLVGVDLDKCRNPDTGAVEPWALDVVRAIDSYTEVSPSGRGLRLFLHGKLPPQGRKKGHYENYSRGRYVTVTGQHVEGTPLTVEHRQAQLEQVHRQVFGEPAGASPPNDTGFRPPADLDDVELIRRAGEARNGVEFLSLLAGAHSFPSASEADLALCNHLAFWCGPNSEDRIDALFRQSGLFRSKWNREDYRRRTIRKALDGRTEFYEPGRGGARDAHATVPESPASESPSWPDPPAKEAYYGLAGDVVRTIEPETEADPVAVLVQFLVAFGNAAGRHAYRPVGTRRHYPNFFICLVGRTASARKGTAWSWVESLLAIADPDWHRDCIPCGLSSGEGLINALHDETAADRRLMAVEEEFGSLLRAAGRDGSILSPVLRQAWDGGRLRTLTRHNPLRATDSHVSIIGHITPPELRQLLGQVETVNGFGNRFLWLLCRRSKVLPDGGELLDLSSLGRCVGEALKEARGRPKPPDTTTMLHRDRAAAVLWRGEYARLTAERPGVLGALTSRAAPQVLRLAVVYALLDSSDQIQEPHLKAALAVWDYCERSCRWIFGESTGDRDADDLVAHLRAAPDGLTRTEMSAFFGRHKTAAQLDRILIVLRESGLVVPGVPATGGKPAGKWRAVANPANPANPVGT